ncbi:MAG: DUF935 family protein [Pseudomonadota bacterium]
MSEISGAGQKMTDEVATVAKDITFPAFMGLLRNQDDTLLTRGGVKGLKVYDDIERDCHAYAVMQKRKMAVISRPWEVRPATDSRLDKKAAGAVHAQLAAAAFDFDRVCLNLLDALLKGYAVGEIMWSISGAGIVAERVIPRDQRRFTFGDDYRPRLLTPQSMTRGEELPERKFIVHSFGGKDGTPSGLGLGTRLFWPVFFKRQDITFWLTFADKFGSPTAVGKYPSGASAADQTKLLDALGAIAQDTGVIVPEGMLIELLEASRSGSTDAYEKLARYMDEQISEAVLGEIMTTTSKASGLGSNQAGVHNEVRLELVKADADLLSGTLNASLVKWIAEYNVPGANPPTVWRQVEEPEDLKELAQRDKTIFDMGFRPTLQYIHDTYGGKWAEQTPPPAGGTPLPPRGEGAAFAESVPVPEQAAQAALDAAIDNLPDTTLQAHMEQALAPVLALVKGGAEFSEIMGKLAETYPDMDTARLEEMLARAIFVSDLWGRVNADVGNA